MSRTASRTVARQVAALEAVRAMPGATAGAIAARMGENLPLVREALAALAESGFVRRTGWPHRYEVADLDD